MFIHPSTNQPTHATTQIPVHPPTHPSCVEIFWCRNVLVPKRLGVFRGMVLNRLDAETSGALCLGLKSLVTKTTWCHLRAMSHFHLVVSALSPFGLIRLVVSILRRFGPESFWSVSVGIG